MKNVELLNRVLLSKDAAYSFYNIYDNNVEFREWIDELIPEVRKCELQKQNTPWHKYNVLGHILHSVEAMNKQAHNYDYSTRRLLAYVMFFHDIGKPDVVSVNPKTGYDRFINHNVNSVEVAKRVLPKLDFDREQIEIMLRLIYKHDLFMFLTDDKINNPNKKELTLEVILKEIQGFNIYGNGKEILNWLVLVGRSDNLAQNEVMAQDSLKLLDKFEELLNKKRKINTL